jgi:hypothetical protein
MYRVSAKRGEDRVGDPAALQPDGLGPGLAASLELLDVGTSSSVSAALGDRDHAQGSVDQPVPATIQADPFLRRCPTTPGWVRCW